MYKDFLKQILIKYPFSFSNIIKKQYPIVFNYLIEKYPQLLNHSISEYIYWELNGFTDFPKCINNGCQNIVKFINIKNGYHKCCSIFCTNKSASHINTVKKTIDNDPLFWEKRNIASAKTKLDRYGDKKYSNTEKAKITRYIKNNGQYHANDFVQKIKNTKYLKFGVENFNNCEKIKTTLNQKKIDNPHYYDIRNNKAKITSFNKYGDENYRNIEKSKETNKLNHDGKLHVNNTDFKKLISKSRRQLTYKKILNDPFKQLNMSFDEFENASKNNLNLEFICRKCGHIFEIKHHIGNHFLYLYKNCPICYPNIFEKFTSELEKELVIFLKSFNFKLYENNRSIISPLELDIYIPDKKIAFEFDGLYWHSEINKPDKNYHLNKTELCEKQGIQLIHIFENEWVYKKDIVKSRIKNLLGIYDKIIFARKCEIKEVDSKTSKEFQDQNHIQGAINAKIHLGLFYQNELISLMTFGKCRFDKKHEWELLRFCNKLGYHIPGGAGKLLKYFERTYKPKSLVSYADRRWSQGKLYKALGFNLDHISKPDYWYWNANEFSSRSKFQKHKLIKYLNVFDENKTEVENMYNNGYNRIFDCGNFVFQKAYNILE